MTSKPYKEFQGNFFDCLTSENKSDMKKFSKAFNPKTEFIIISYVFHMPDLIVKSGENKGKVSKKSKDLSNIEKPIEDQIFKILQIDNNQIDDCMVLTVNKRKVFGPKHRIDVEFSKGKLG